LHKKFLDVCDKHTLEKLESLTPEELKELLPNIKVILAGNISPHV
jgi:hypothetical protein